LLIYAQTALPGPNTPLDARSTRIIYIPIGGGALEFGALPVFVRRRVMRRFAKTPYAKVIGVTAGGTVVFIGMTLTINEDRVCPRPGHDLEIPGCGASDDAPEGKRMLIASSTGTASGSMSSIVSMPGAYVDHAMGEGDFRVVPGSDTRRPASFDPRNVLVTWS